MELCSEMHGSVSARPLQQMAPHLLVFIFCCFPVQSVLSELVFSTRPEGGAAVLGAPLTMHCAVFDPQQQKALPVRWERADGEGPLSALHPGSVDVLVLANGSLFIPRLRHKHLGKYVCCAGDGAHRISTAVQVEKAGLESVFFSPRAQTVMEGESVFLQCVSGDSSPPAHITWLKGRTLVDTGRQIQGQYGGGAQKKTSGTLRLSNVTLKDEGTYSCVTLNPLLNISQESQAARLTVQVAPRRLQITQGPENVTVALGTDASMCCAVRGFPAPTVHWFKDGAPLTNGSGSFSFQDNRQLLVFRNVSEKDEGSYHCTASNQRETLRSETALLLSAVMGWSFARQPSDLTVRSGEKATLVCRPPLSRPSAHVSWFRNSQPLAPKDHLTVQPSGDLFFYSVQESDGGSYFCRASNSHLKRSVASSKATLTVLAPPVVKLWPQVATVPMGARVLLECQVWGHRPLSIRWFKQGSKKTGGKIVMGVRNATLHIPSVRSYDEGTYICEASNTAGQNHSAATLTVAVSPIILSHAWQVSSRIGASVALPCRAVGVLPIAYTWTRDRGETRTTVVPSEDRHIDDDGALHFSSAHLSDAGEYYCTAENRAGRQQRPTVLTVTAEEDPTDTAKQTRLNLPASTDDSERVSPESSDSGVEERVGPTHYPHVETAPTYSIQSRFTSHKGPSANKPLISSTLLKDQAMSRLHGPPDFQSQFPLDRPTTIPTEPIVTQMQPPLLEPLVPYLEVQSTDQHSQPPLTNAPFSNALTYSQPVLISNQLSVLHTQYLLSQSKFQTTQTSSGTQIQHEINESPTQATTYDAQTSGVPFQHLISEPPNVSSLNKVLVPSTQTPISQLPTSGSSEQSFTDLRNVATKPNLYRSGPGVSSLDSAESSRAQLVFTATQSSSARSQTPQGHPLRPLSQSLLPLSKLLPPSTPHQSPYVQTQPARNKDQPSQTLYPQTQTQEQPSATQPQLTFTTSALTPTQSSPTRYHHPLHTQPKPPQTESWMPQNQPGTPPVLQSPRSTVRPPDLTSSASTSDVKVPGTHRATAAGQTHPNVRQQARPSHQDELANDTEPTEWLKRNTSQSPMTSNDPKVTERSPSWLPVLEKHDIPIVVGVGVSLAFIFITMAFYSLVQKNEPAPTSRAGDQFTAQRNLGVPARHTEHCAIARTYENRAFEDDECMAVIEQSPNTSDTRARPPALSLVTVQMEPAVEDLLEEDLQPALEDQLVTVETYPDPLLDTQIDPPPPEGEDGRSLSQPSIQLQCVEDWAGNGNRGDNHSQCQEEAMPPPPLSSLPSGCPSPSPPPPPAREEGLRSSLTLRTTESCVPPIHHSLSISHGSPPLLLSHHVSVGLTTVAVDVHFYPAATGAVGVSSSTHINSVSSATSMTGPVFTSSLANSQENEQATPRMHHNK